MMYGNKIGEMAWMDLSVANASEVKDFYQQVLGWKSESINMTGGDESYCDYAMSLPIEDEQDEQLKSHTTSPKLVKGTFSTGICHAKGDNADMPATWLPYFLVANIDVAIMEVKTHGGALVTNIKSMGNERYIVIKDPAGAMCVLYQK